MSPQRPRQPTPVPTPGPACEQHGGLLAGAALDVLEPKEVLAVQGHVAQCAPCAVELARLREGAAVLALAVPSAAPPQALKARVLAAAADESRPPERPAPFAPVARRRPVAGSWLAAAAALVVAASSVVWAASLQARVDQLAAQAQADRDKAARYDRVVAVLASEQLAIRQLEPAAQASSSSGTIYMDPSTGQGMIMVHDLPPIPAERQWQLWFVRSDGTRVSGGLLRADATGSGYTLLNVPKDLHTFEAIGITQEPRGGSPSPTGERVLGGRL